MGRYINPPARRRCPQAMPPLAATPAVATLVVEFNVQYSLTLYETAAKQMRREGAASREIIAALRTYGDVVDVAACIRVLTVPVVERVAERTHIELVDTGLYIEPVEDVT